jgi:hypothetical protein
MHLTTPGKLFTDRVLPLVRSAERENVVLSIENVHRLPIEPNAAWHSAGDMNMTFLPLFEVLSSREKKHLGMTLDLGHALASPQGAPDKFLRELDTDIPIAVVHAHGSDFLNQTAEVPGLKAGDECGADYPAACRKNAEGIFPVSYDTGLIEKETPGFSPGSFIQMTQETHLPLYKALSLNGALEEVVKILIEERGFSEVFILEYESTPENLQRVAVRAAALLGKIIQKVLNNDGGDWRYKMSVPFEVWNNATGVMEGERFYLSGKELSKLQDHTLKNFILPLSGAVYVGNRIWKTFSLLPQAEAEVVINGGRVRAVRIIRDKEGRPVLDKEGNGYYFIIGRDRNKRVYPPSISPSRKSLIRRLRMPEAL